MPPADPFPAPWGEEFEARLPRSERPLAVAVRTRIQSRQWARTWRRTWDDALPGVTWRWPGIIGHCPPGSALAPFLAYYPTISTTRDVKLGPGPTMGWGSLYNQHASVIAKSIGPTWYPAFLRFLRDLTAENIGHSTNASVEGIGENLYFSFLEDDVTAALEELVRACGADAGVRFLQETYGKTWTPRGVWDSIQLESLRLSRPFPRPSAR